jgi:hypothetical protein
MKWRLLFACGFCSLCASLPLHAADGPPQQNADPLTERVAALVQSSDASTQSAPVEGGEAGTAPKKADGDAAAPKKSGDADAAGNKKNDKGAAAKNKKKPRNGKKKQDADSAAGRKISLDEDFLVEGKLEKPNAYYILRRSQAGYDWARLDAKFLPLVLESVQDPLF